MRLVLAALLAAALAVPASAAAKSPDDFSASDQYVETVPTPNGPSATRDGKPRQTPLRPSVAAKLRSQGGADASRLEAIATSSDFGAPQGTAGRADKKNGTRDKSRNTTAIPSASVQAVREGGGGLLWLLLALLAITGLMAGAVTYRRHKNTNSS